MPARPASSWPRSTARADLAPGAPVSVAVRPEKLEIAAARPASGNAITGRCLAEAYLGDRSHYYVGAEGLPKPIAAAAQEQAARLDLRARR